MYGNTQCNPYIQGTTMPFDINVVFWQRVGIPMGTDCAITCKPVFILL